MRQLTDGFGRQFRYLRLSVTDACNFRCSYCLPEGFRRTEAEPELSLSEIGNLLEGFAGMGFSKVRITGGEPTLREDLVEIVAMAARTRGISRVALSSNGYRISGLLSELRRAGLAALNISIDSLDRARFARITGRDKLTEVVGAVAEAMALGIEVKINCVLLSGLNDDDIGPLLECAREAPLTVRFIELMETGNGAEFFEKHHVSAADLGRRLTEAGWRPTERDDIAGPAVELAHPRYRGKAGIIAPYSKNFCVSCNRLRVDARGRLKLCLFGDGSTSLRSYLASRRQLPALRAAVRDLVLGKAPAHSLAERRTGSTTSLSILGG